MRGRIWVESTVGEGSTFHMEGEFTRGDAAEETIDLPAEFRDLPVLLVDDNPRSRLVYEELLADYGCRSCGDAARRPDRDGPRRRRGLARPRGNHRRRHARH